MRTAIYWSLLWVLTASGRVVKQVAVIGEGVLGTSAALALLERRNDLNVTVFHKDDFKKTCSYGAAGLFRLELRGDKEYGRRSFARYAKIYRSFNPAKSGVNLVSGHILSTNRSDLTDQDDNYGDIVYNFHYLRDDEMKQFPKQPDSDKLYAIHYTAYTTEGGKYVPWMKQQLLRKGVHFVKKEIGTVNDLVPDYDIIVNCAGLNGGTVAGDGDDKNMYPIRGTIFQVDAKWHNHFLFRGFETFSIPTTDAFFIGSLKDRGRWDFNVTKEDREKVLGRYYKLQPTLKTARVLRSWSQLRPARVGGSRVELVQLRRPDNRRIKVVHNYGHGGHGFSVSWGCAETVADLLFPDHTTSPAAPPPSCCECPKTSVYGRAPDPSRSQ